MTLRAAKNPKHGVNHLVFELVPYRARIIGGATLNLFCNQSYRWQQEAEHNMCVKGLPHRGFWSRMREQSQARQKASVFGDCEV